jgi:hypothetical protein
MTKAKRTKIWPVVKKSEGYRYFDAETGEARTIQDTYRYWLVECACQEKPQGYQMEANSRDLDYCPECKAPGEIATWAWPGEESTQGTPTGQ